MVSIISMSQSPINFDITENVTQKNGEARSQSSDVVAYLDIAELGVLRDDIKKQNKKRVPTIRLIFQYEKFFTRRMSTCPQMVRSLEARIEELEDNEIDGLYDKDWGAIQYVKPKKINKGGSLGRLAVA